MPLIDLLWVLISWGNQVNPNIKYENTAADVRSEANPGRTKVSLQNARGCQSHRWVEDSSDVSKKLRNRAGGPLMPELPLPACSQVNPSVFNDSRIFDSLSPWGGPSRDLAADKTARVECGRKNLTKYLFIIGGLRLRVLRTDWRICWYLFYHDIRSRL